VLGFKKWNKIIGFAAKMVAAASEKFTANVLETAND
jgi:hypothetical protein